MFYKEISMRIIFIIILLSVFGHAVGQVSPDPSPRKKVFVSSGLGFGFPVGDINQALSPKVSNILGLNIPLSSDRYFLYPVVDFLRFSYDEIVENPNSEFRLQNGSLNMYGLSIMPGINQFLGSLRLYAYAGPSLQLIYEPHIVVDISAGQADIKKTSSWTGGLRGGMGAHYRMGDFYLFVESAYVRNFRETQGSDLSVITLHGGLKTDVTLLIDKIF